MVPPPCPWLVHVRRHLGASPHPPVPTETNPSCSSGVLLWISTLLRSPAMELVTYERSDAVATIAMDDGKVNCLSPRMLGELNEALDRAESDHATVLLIGREGRFSAGFDLPVLRAGG